MSGWDWRRGASRGALGWRLTRERLFQFSLALECTKCATCTSEKLHRPPCTRPLHCPTRRCSSLQFGSVRRFPLHGGPLPALPAPPQCSHSLKTFTIDIPLISYFARVRDFIKISALLGSFLAVWAISRGLILLPRGSP